MDEKYLRYRANRIANDKGISLEEALVIANQEIAADKDAVKQLKIEKLKVTSKKLTQKLKSKNKKTTYIVGDKVVDSVVSGGLPSLGKN